MAPAASSASIRSATSAAASSKRPHASDAEPPLLEVQGDDGAEAARKGQQQQPSRQQQQQQLECPRCQSTNTKFCYYNNYSTAQPRHFCRACRRYWTHGGTLRDVPVGGASRRSTGGGGGKRRRVSAEPEPSLSSASASSPPPPPQTAAGADAFLLAPDLSAFPFLSDGSFLMPPQLDLGVAQPATFSSWQSVVPDFYDGLAPWDDDGAAGMTGPWGDIAGGLDIAGELIVAVDRSPL